MSRLSFPLLLASLFFFCSPLAAAQTPKDDPPKPVEEKPKEQAKEQPKKPFELMIGDVAPAIHIDEWLAGEATALENGNLYWISFWATWSQASLDSFATLTDLQQRHAEKGLVVLGLTREDELGNRLFSVKKEVEAHADEIGFRIGWDASGKTWERFMTAAGFNKIPHGILVDRTGRVAYMGHPGGLDEVLGKILDGKFDIEEAAKTYAKIVNDALHRRGIEARLSDAYSKGKLGEVLLAFDELIALGPKFRHYAVNKFQLLIKDMGDSESAYAWAVEAAATCLNDDSYALNTLAYSIVTRVDFTPKNYDVAMQLAHQASLLKEEKDGQIWNTIGVIHSKRLDWKEAVDAMQKAVEFAGRENQRQSYARSLATFRKKLREQG